jgi:pantoate kinase
VYSNHFEVRMNTIEELREMLARERPHSPCLIHEATIKRGVGLGDMIAKITSAVGIKPCKGCKKRQSWLNRFKIG